MKRIEKEYTRVEKNVYFEAYDGTHFTNEDECIKYESNAKAVAGKKVQAFLVKRTYSESIFSDFHATCDEKVEIYLPRNMEDVDALNNYLNFVYSDYDVIGSECIGKYVVVDYSYDEDWCRAQIFEDKIENFKKLFEKMVAPKEEEKTNA